MMSRRPEAVRLTHLPTGVSVTQSAAFFPRRVYWPHACTVLARLRLASELCRPAETPNPVRSYHLDPRWSGETEPFVRQGGVTLAVGRESVAGVLDGRLPWLERGDSWPIN